MGSDEAERDVKTTNQYQKDRNGADKPFVLHFDFVVILLFLLIRFYDDIPRKHVAKPTVPVESLFFILQIYGFFLMF